MSFVPKDVIVLPESDAAHPDRWVAMNVFARTCLGLDSAGVRLLGTIEAGDGEGQESFRCWDIQRFSNEDGLLADPTRYVRDVTHWKEQTLAREAMVAKLKAHAIIVDDEAAYRARFQPKRNLLDWERFGNFHQQHGQHMMLNKRTDPVQWWMDQKFTPDRQSVRKDTLYGAVQWAFLEDYFGTRIKPSMQAIDLGCGTGIYANLMARHGATVLGIDPSDEYLEVARKSAAAGVRFERGEIGSPGGLDGVPTSSADIVFMSDALLFYFVPFYPGQKTDLPDLLASVKRILKPGGAFISLEPHASFFLNAWLGAPDRPFTVMTEYLHKWFGIVPPLSWLVRAFVDAGFAVTDLREIGPADYFEKVDLRAYHFAREFPLWHLLELRVLA